jgi:hypothetical protein
MPNFFFGLGTYLADKRVTMVNMAIKFDKLNGVNPVISLDTNTVG